MKLFATSILIASLYPLPGLATSPKVTVTLSPIHSLVSQVMESVGTPYLLLEGKDSPHTYSLKPSQMQQLQDSNLIIWVGPGMESFLVKPLSTLHTVPQLELMEIAGLIRLGSQEVEHTKNEETNATDQDHVGQDHEYNSHEHDHEEGQFDPHIWLDPHNAQRIVEAVVSALGQQDQAHVSVYQRNGERLKQRLKELDEQLRQRLDKVKNRPFLVFHDAYLYFEQRYHLNKVGKVSLQVEQVPGAQHLSKLRSQIRKLQVVCVFNEPQFESALVTTLIEGSSAKSGILDPLGADFPTGPETYFLLLNKLADSLVACLQSD